MINKTLTSESVLRGHPDKVADQISDAILDHALVQDPAARVAVETLVKGTSVILAGEITADALIPVPEIVELVLRDIGYSYTPDVRTLITKQSPQIDYYVSGGHRKWRKDRVYAGDQGSVFGFATNETEAYLALPHYYAQKIAGVLNNLKVEGLGPDGKVQVTVTYNDNGPVVENVTVSLLHHPDWYILDVFKHIENAVLAVISLEQLVGSITMNPPDGRFIFGGPEADAGVTGRKIIVDTYGGACPHGGGAFSGKDATKVDRSGAYLARFLAKNIVFQKLADTAQVQLAYRMGAQMGMYLDIQVQGAPGPYEEIVGYVTDSFSSSVQATIDEFGLTQPVGWTYRQTAENGHFGHPQFPWEKMF